MTFFSLLCIGYYVADRKHVVGYGFPPSAAARASTGGAIESLELWRLDAAGTEEVIEIIAPEESEVLGGETVRLADGNYLRKVLAPSVLVLLRNGTHTLRALRVDTRSGAVLSAHTHTHAAVRGSAAAAMSENWHMYTYWNTRLQRHEVAIVELYHAPPSDRPLAGADVVHKPHALQVRTYAQSTATI